MAKTKKEDMIGQQVKLIALVTGGEIKEDVGAKKQEVIELKLKTPNGSLLKLSNFINDSDNDFVQEKTQELRDIVKQVNDGEKVYIKKNIYINKEGKQYGWLTSQESDEDKVYHQLDGFIDVLEYEEMGDGDYVTYSTFNNEVTKKFEDIKNSIKILMFVKDKRADRVYLTNDGEYEKGIIIDVTDTAKIEIGVAYEVQLAFKKGAMIKSEEVEEASDWDSEESKGNVTFEPDRLIPIGVRKTKLESSIAGSSDEDDDEMPF